MRVTYRLLCTLVFLMIACPAGGDGIPNPDLRGIEPDIAAAVRQAQQRVRAEPTRAAAWGALGDRLYAHQWYDEAAVCFERAEQLEPGWFAWPYRLAHSLIDTPRAHASLAPFERALNINAFHAPGEESYARALMRAGRLDEARRRFERASTLDPRSSHAEVGLGHVAIAERRLDQARVHLERALQRNPGHGEAHKALAQVLFALGFDDDAAAHAAQAQQLPKRTFRTDPDMPAAEPRGSVALTNEGKRLERAGSMSQAEARYRAALEVNPQYQQARLHLGKLLARHGRLAEAVEHLRLAAELKSTQDSAWESLGFTLMQLGRPLEAIEALERAARLNPANPGGRYALGTLLAKTGRPVEAIEHLEAAARQRPDHSETAVNLALACADAGTPERAYAVLADHLDRFPEEAKLQFAAGRIAEASGDLAEARRYYRRAADLRPEWSVPHTALARLSEQHVAGR